jgi:hypothetical protein
LVSIAPPHLSSNAKISLLIISLRGRTAVPRSVLEAIKQGEWNFEPGDDAAAAIRATTAMPGTAEKLDVLAERLQRGVPLWHPRDRMSYDDREEA